MMAMVSGHLSGVVSLALLKVAVYCSFAVLTVLGTLSAGFGKVPADGHLPMILKARE